MNTLTLSQIDAAVDAAFQTALAAPQRIAPQQIGDGCNLRTDVYVGPRGSGFAVVAQIKIGQRTIARVRQHGPETWREHDWDRKAINDALEADYNAKAAMGITVNGVTLAAAESDRAKFTQLIALLREAEELQSDDASKTAFRASTTKIADIHDAVHEVAVTEARQLIVQYGQTLNALWTDYANRRAALSI